MEVERMEMNVIITAVDLDNEGNPWIMGETLEIDINPDAPVQTFLEKIADIKQIDINRMKIIVPPDRVITCEMYELSLRRSGINHQENRVELRPTTPGVWSWHPIDYYEQLYVKELKRVIGNDELSLSEVIQIAKKPPVLRTSTRVFLRKYPDLFFVSTSLVSNLSTVRLNTENSLPLFY
uniref:Uncharacterized protein n=1 Tax=Aureoumbra lagunensis TaxID=44058 RepID=A0A7S3NQ47_9STRA|mmetsp:Transcript_19100/g.24778  ORF Transcript_19100/g.24778 Transcript_19100/m.24778 type:complete len:180 (-) Transcript_19100:80-619(-)